MFRFPRIHATAEFLKASVIALGLGLALVPLHAAAQNPPLQQSSQSPQTSPTAAPEPQAAEQAQDAHQQMPAATQAAPETKPEAALPPTLPAKSLPHNLSPWGMFLAADIVVKFVMLGLAFASVVTWTVWLAKSVELFAARRQAEAQLEVLAHAKSLTDVERRLGNAKGAVARMIAAVIGEIERSEDLAHPDVAEQNKEGIKERASTLVSRIEARAGRQMSRGTGMLATIGATAPFIGLFGTVWGIMNSFIGISKTNTTNLAVVAPGIAEALLATAIGLVAAIPAVVIYNIFSRSIASYRATLGDGAAEVMRHLSRDLDRLQQAAGQDDWQPAAMRRSAE